jgi:hypothetical protein
MDNKQQKAGGERSGLNTQARLAAFHPLFLLKHFCNNLRQLRAQLSALIPDLNLHITSE